MFIKRLNDVYSKIENYFKNMLLFLKIQYLFNYKRNSLQFTNSYAFNLCIKRIFEENKNPNDIKHG